MSATTRTLALAVVSTVALLLAPTAAAAPAMSAPAATTALPAAKVATAKKVTFRLQTKVKTVMYTSAKGSKKRATIPADYTMKAKSATLKNSRYKVTYKGKTGWVKKSRYASAAVLFFAFEGTARVSSIFPPSTALSAASSEVGSGK